MKKNFVRIFSVVLSIMTVFCSAACTGNNSAAGLSASLEAKIIDIGSESYYSDDGHLILTAEGDSIVFSSGEQGIAELAQKDFEMFVSSRDALSGDEYGDIGLAAYIALAKSEYQATEAGNYTPRVFERVITPMRTDDVVLSFLLVESSCKQVLSSTDTGSTVTYAVSYDARTGLRLTLENIALEGIDFAAYLSDYAIDYLYTNYSDDLYPDVEDRLENFVCQDGYWYFDEYGIMLICNSEFVSTPTNTLIEISVPYTELVKVIKAEYIPETASVGLSPFGEGFLGDDSTAEISGKIVSADNSTLIIESEENGTVELVIADKDTRKLAAELVGHDVDIVYYTSTGEIASMTLSEK